jgi:hypothetical protein
MDQDPRADAPPLLSTWPRVYAAVLLLEAVVLVALALFSAWPY